MSSVRLALQLQRMERASAGMEMLANKGHSIISAFTNFPQINTSLTVDLLKPTKLTATHIYDVLGIGLERQSSHVDKMK